MKKIASNTICGFVLVATISLGIISCTKNENRNFKAVNAALRSNTLNLSTTAVSSCGTIPSDLQVPPGNKLALQTYARGVQIYQVRRSAIDTNIYEWVNIAPSATLYTKPDFTNVLANHYKGPTWEFIKGNFKDIKVVGSKWKGAVVNAAAIPWLILKAVDSLSTAGNKITYIQRICTTGGLQPSTQASASNLGTVDSIPYTASYLFYIKD